MWRSPRVAEYLLRRALPAEQREGILGDLEETAATLVPVLGPRGSRRWYWGQALRLSVGFARERWFPSTAPRQRSRDKDMAMWRLGQDVKFAVRMAAQTPWLTAAAVFALGAGMAVTIIGFSVAWSANFASLPFPDPDRIVAVRDIGVPDPDDVPPSLLVFREWEERQRSFDRIAAYYRRGRDVVDGDGGFVRQFVAVMTASGFDVPGVAPLMGRSLRSDDEEPGAPPVVVLGYQAWQSLLGGRPDAVGQTLTIGQDEREIVGVMPEGFRFPVSADMWVPFPRQVAIVEEDQPRWMRVFGRLAAGVSLEQAQADLDGIRAGYAERLPEAEDIRDRFTTVIPYIQGESEPGTEVLYVVVVVFLIGILVVACASVANLLLARASSRTGEIAVRAALGASRRRLVTQLLVEALLLSSAGAVVGVVTTHVGLLWFSGFIPTGNLPFWVELRMTLPAVVFAGLAAIGAAVVSGVTPALRATGMAVNDVLKDEQGTASGIRFGRLSATLTVVEVALTVAFLAAAGAAVRGYVVARSNPDRLPVDEVLSISVQLPSSEDGVSTDQWPAMHDEILRRLAGLSGVRSAASATSLAGTQHRRPRIEIERAPDGETDLRGTRVSTAVVSSEYFELLGNSVSMGRGFGPEDAPDSVPVAIVNESFARRFFAGRGALGERFRRITFDDDAPWLTIVGIAPDLHMNPGNRTSQAGFYTPLTQEPRGFFDAAMRTDGDPTALVADARRAIKSVDRRIEVSDIGTMAQKGDAVLLMFRLMSLFFSAIGAMTLFLAVAGLYAVMSFSVTQRTREIGIRVALGADHNRVMRVVLRRGLLQVGLGIALGSLLGWALLRLLTQFPIDFASGGTGGLVFVALAMLAAGVIACIVPGRRALGIHPVEALRHN